jgi:hypothetical protein
MQRSPTPKQIRMALANLNWSARDFCIHCKRDENHRFKYHHVCELLNERRIRLSILLDMARILRAMGFNFLEDGQSVTRGAVRLIAIDGPEPPLTRALQLAKNR